MATPRRRTAAAAPPRSPEDMMDKMEDHAKLIRKYGLPGLVAILLASGSSVASLAAWAQLPEKVKANTDAIAAAQARIAVVEARIGRIEENQRFTVCYVRSQIEETNPAACRFLDPARRAPNDQ
jgi:hypothetical protein